jgi:hypothetical protein
MSVARRGRGVAFDDQIKCRDLVARLLYRLGLTPEWTNNIPVENLREKIIAWTVAINFEKGTPVHPGQLPLDVGSTPDMSSAGSMLVPGFQASYYVHAPVGSRANTTHHAIQRVFTPWWKVLSL